MKFNLRPVGQAHDTLDALASDVMSKWSLINKIQQLSWWQWLMGNTKVSYLRVTAFVLHMLDLFIKEIEKSDISGADKKATVIKVISKVYDHAIADALPIWLQPWSSTIKHVVISVLISYSIDWMVEKYNNGEWKK